MSDERQRDILQDVDPSQLGQLSPGYTPATPGLQSQSRGRELSRGGESRQLGKATGQPQQTEMGSEGLLKAGQEAAKNLNEYSRTSEKELQQKSDSYAADRVTTEVKATGKHESTSNVHESDKDLAHNKKVEKNRRKRTPMSDNVIPIYEHLRNQRAKSIDEQPVREKEPYQAAEVEKRDRRVLRLLINFSDGGVDLCSYGKLANIYSVSPNYINLIFSSGVVYLEGDNLRLLLPDFQEERIHTIQSFDFDRHKTPEPGTPVIRKIDWKSPEQVVEKSQSY